MINIIYGNLYLQATMEGNGEFTDELYTRLSDDIFLFLIWLIQGKKVVPDLIYRGRKLSQIWYTGEESCPRSDIKGKQVCPDLIYRGRKSSQIWHTGEESCPISDIQGKKVVPDLKYRGRKLSQIWYTGEESLPRSDTECLIWNISKAWNLCPLQKNTIASLILVFQ